MTTFARVRRTVGVLMMASSLSLGVLLAPAAIAEGEVPEDREAVELAREAFWNGDKTNYTKNAATKQFPPEAVCLVQPSACFFPEDDSPQGQVGGLGNTAVQTVDQQQRELLGTMAENESGQDPAEAVPPDTLPVSVAFGQANYRSAVDFELPALPSGQQVDSFQMVLTQTSPTYSNESPAFRQAVLAALTCAQENESSPIGRCTQEEFEKVDPEQLSDDGPLLVEACPIIGEWKEGEAQDEDDLPEVDCLFSSSGQPVTDGETIYWVFDLTFAAQAWFDGTIAQNGILLRPGAAENFAYGDPETTYSKQVTFENTVEVAMTSSEALAAPPPPPPPPSFDSTSGGFETGTSSDFGSVPAPSSSSDFGVPASTSMGTDQTPAVSTDPGGEVPAPAAAGDEMATLAAGTPLGEPASPWWLWLLAPMFAGGAWMLSRSLEEQAVAATERSGAMTRLLERQAAMRADGLVTG